MSNKYALEILKNRVSYLYESIEEIEGGRVCLNPYNPNIISELRIKIKELEGSVKILEKETI
jgi:hypothetical protein